MKREDLSKRQTLLRFGSILFGLIVVTAAVEVAIRALGVEASPMRLKRVLTEEPLGAILYHCYPSNPNMEFEAVPDVSRGRWRLQSYESNPRDIPLNRLHETPWCVQCSYSSFGIRDREYSREPSPGVLRIAGMGDSFMVGEGVPIELALPRQIGEILGEGYEVLNCGERGDDTLDQLEALREIIASTACSRAILQFLPNDIHLTPELDRRQSEINNLVLTHDEGIRKGRGLRLFELALSRFKSRRIERLTTQWYLDSFEPQYNSKNLRDLNLAFRQLATLPNCRVALVIYPMLMGFEGGYPLTAIHERVSRMGREAGLPVLDLAPFFAGMETESLWAHEVDHHPNGKAHGIAAAAIVEWLRAEVPEFLEPNPIISK